jgi:hypothetical protein
MMGLKQFAFWVLELQAGCRPDKFRQESDSAHLTMNAIPISVLAICSAVWFLVGVVSAEQTDFSAASASNEKPEPVSPGEAEIVALLEQLGPRSKGMGVGINDDGAATLSISADEENDLSALSGLRVRHVQIMGSMSELAAGKIMDLGPLAGMPLETLWVWKVPLKDLSPLKTTRLKKLLIMGAKITDISPLKDLPLTDLALWSTDVSDISPLKGMHLKHLDIDSSESARVEDVTPLSGMSLESLRFHANGVTQGIEVLRSMKSLKEINRMKPEEFWKGYDADASVRERVAKVGLKFTKLDGGADGTIGLWFHGEDLVDLSPLIGLPVVSLGFRDSEVSDLRPVAGLPLHSLCIRSPALTDLSPLRGTPITALYLDCDHLTDLAPLQETKLQTLSVKSPQLTDFSAVRNLPLKYLNIRGCGASDLGFLEGMSIEDIHFDLERITEGLEVLRGMKALKQINSCKTEDFWKERDRKMTDEGDSSAADPFSK